MQNTAYFNNPGVESAWRQVRNVLYSPETKMVYDFVTSHEPERRFALLPVPEEIEKGFPNPCGWSTGMEDCALNGGILLAMLSGDGADIDFACDVAEGIIRCGTVHGTPGFIARGIALSDKRSCYTNSSRDQFTLAMYGMWSFLKSSGVPEELAERGRKFVSAVADYCRSTVTAENQYSLGRLDGGPAVVSGMWECMPHEAMRLPMIYGIAWDITGMRCYFDWLTEYAAEALRQTMEIKSGAEYWWDMPLLQMQLSLKFFLDSNILPELRDDICRTMKIAQETAIGKLKIQTEKLEKFSGSFEVLYDNWRTLPMVMRSETLSADGSCGLFGGQSYMNPVFRSEYAAPNAMLRAIGNYLAVAACGEEENLPWELYERCSRILADFDFSRFAGNGTVALAYGFSLWEKKKERKR